MIKNYNNGEKYIYAVIFILKAGADKFYKNILIINLKILSKFPKIFLFPLVTVTCNNKLNN